MKVDVAKQKRIVVEVTNLTVYSIYCSTNFFLNVMCVDGVKRIPGKRELKYKGSWTEKKIESYHCMGAVGNNR